MTDFKMSKGRVTVRKNGGRRTRLWELSNSNNPTVQKLEAVYLAGLGAMDCAEARHAANKTDSRFTPEGARDDLLKFVLTDAVPALHRGRTAIKKARAEVAERRSKLKVEGPDPSDIAAAFRRMEIRTRLREMKPEELTQYFARYGDNLPTEIAQAVTELPAEYSGVPQSRHDLLTERALNARFGGAIAEIKEIEQAIEAADSTVEAARDEIRLELGILDPAKFNALASPIETKHSAPWLRRKKANGTEEVCVVDLDRGVERPATPEEVERGIFYNDFEHYKEGKQHDTADQQQSRPDDARRSCEGSGRRDASRTTRDVGQGGPGD